MGNNLWEHTSFNSRLQPQQMGLGTASANSSVLALDYDYGTTNNNGNVRSQTITAPELTLVQSYEYDEVNRLKSAREMNGATESWKQGFTYLDASGGNARFGNRRIDAAHTTASLITENPQFNPANNRIAPQAGELYEYDAAGNLTKDKGGNTFAYDGENRQATYNGGASINGGATYSYDGDGKRVKKVAGVVSIVFVYDAMGQLVAEYGSATATANGTQYLTADHLGTPRVVTLADGRVKARHDYLPFGEEIGAGVGGRTTNQGYSQADGVRQKFTSKERDDETGLDYFLARYYSSAQGRFTSPDEFTGGPDELYNFADTASANPTFYADLRNPQSLNKYQYAYNNPLRYVDPDGHDPDPDPCCDQETTKNVGTGAVVGGAIGSVIGGIIGGAGGAVGGGTVGTLVAPGPGTIGGVIIGGGGGGMKGAAIGGAIGAAIGAGIGYLLSPDSPPAQQVQPQTGTPPQPQAQPMPPPTPMEARRDAPSKKAAKEAFNKEAGDTPRRTIRDRNTGRLKGVGADKASYRPKGKGRYSVTPRSGKAKKVEHFEP